MAYLIEFCFDNSHRLSRKGYLFEYRNIKFKLVQDNPRKWADHLMTITPENDSAAYDRAFSVASEFLSALGWEHNARVAIWEAGGGSWPDQYSLKKAEPRIFTFPRIPFGGNIIGFNLYGIPHVQTEDQRIALALFREANASNNAYLSFLFYWQVLEVGGGRPENFINKTLRRHRNRIFLQPSDISDLPLAGQSLGQYLLNDCRHAIAHIRRNPGKKKLDLDKPDERRRLAKSVSIVKEFAKFYIREVSGLKEKLFLVRQRKGDFPIFIDQQRLRSGYFKPAYPPLQPRVKQMRTLR